MSDMKGRTFQNDAHELQIIYKKSENQSVNDMSPDQCSGKPALAICISVGMFVIGIGLGIGISMVTDNFDFLTQQSRSLKTSMETITPIDGFGNSSPVTQESTAPSTEQSTPGHLEETSATTVGCPNEEDLFADNLSLNETLTNCTISMAKQSKTISDCEEDKITKLLEEETKIKELKKLAEKERAEKLRVTAEAEMLKVAQASDRATIAQLTTFNATFSKISQLTGWTKSRPYHVYGVPWKIAMKPYTSTEKYLGIHLRCNDEVVSQTWSHRIKFVLKLLSHKPEVKPISMEADYCNFTKGSENWGWNEFIKWSDLLNPLKGYAKDDSITVVARVTP